MVRLAPKHTEQELRNYLGSFGFHGDKALDPISPFSGGEKARLVLALLVWQKPNLLLLDEPTNHLDLDMRSALTMALQSFEGAMVIVSHDRFLLRATTDDLYLVDNGQVQPFDGDLNDYHQWLGEQQRSERRQEQEDNNKISANTSQAQRKEQKRLEAEFRKLTAPIRKKIATLEAKLDEYSSQLQQHEHLLSDPTLYQAENKDKLTELLREQSSAKTSLEEVEIEWMELQEQLEAMDLAFQNP